MGASVGINTKSLCANIQRMSNYLSEVSNLFLQRRGSSLGLSPLDWQVISEWELHNIPLHIVCRAINDVFDNYERMPKEKKKRKITSISYCQEEVETAFEDWLSLQVGK